MSATYRHDYRAFDELVLSAPWMVAEMLKRATHGMEFAQSIAPFDARDKDGDHYREHFSVEAGVREKPTRRAYGRLTNDSDIAVYVEFGSVHNERHRVLGRSLDAMKE